MAGYQLITDATADLSLPLMQSLAVEVIPMEVIVEGAAYTFAPEGGSITQEEFFAAMREGKNVGTSQITPAVYEMYFEKHLSAGVDVLYVCFSSNLSGMAATASSSMEALREKYPNRKLICIDSLCASVGEGFLVYAAAQLKQQGMAIEELADWLLQHRLRVCHWFTVADLQQLQRGGRLSATTAKLGTALNIKPVLHVDDEGRLVYAAKTRGRKKSLIALADHMDETWTPELGKTVFIAHGDALDDAEYLKKRVLKRHAEAQVTILPLGPVIGAHTGPGVIALFFFGSQR